MANTPQDSGIHLFLENPGIVLDGLVEIRLEHFVVFIGKIHGERGEMTDAALAVCLHLSARECTVPRNLRKRTIVPAPTAEERLVKPVFQNLRRLGGKHLQ